jgi:hypothetical protein
MNLPAIALALLSFGPQAGDRPLPSLDDILEREAEYCLRLEQAALNFVCLENITEKINRSKDIKLNQSASVDLTTDGTWARSEAGIPSSKVKRTFLYDFQYVREGKGIKETRTLLRENGQVKKEENAILKTSNFVYRNALLGPVAIFGRQWHDVYDYKAAGERRLGDRLCIVIDVSPKSPEANFGFLFGRAFIEKTTLEILKIEWSEQRIGNYEVFEKRGERYGMKPHISMTSEFEVEKSGIRFPSRHFIEEAYLNKKGKKFVRSETSVAYTDFRFFTVTVEETIAK